MKYFLVTLFCFFFLVQASPLSLSLRATHDIFTPTIKSPNADTTWVIGRNETVEWETDSAPENISNRASIILKGYPKPLAEGFDLRLGKMDISVPKDVEPGYYTIVLFGDSGNTSPAFSIVKPSILDMND